MNEQTIEKLRGMRLSGFITGLTEQSESATYADMSFEDRFSFLVEKEYLRRKNNSIKTAIRAARLKQSAFVEDLDYSPKRNIKKGHILELASCEWINQAQNLLITGPTGVGKSYLACALGDRACRLGFKVHYIKLNELVRQILLSQAEGVYPKLVSKFAKIKLLIIDEWLRDSLPQNHAREILDLVDDRYQKVSTIFCSQLPVKNWHQNIKDPTLADAILDRIVHNSHRIQMKGESMRKPLADDTLRKKG